MSQVILPEYTRSPVKKKPIWQHCCLAQWCFQEKTKTTEK
jgi:hypothetical protein